MHSQLYLTGRLAAAPELLQTGKGKLWARLLLETRFVRETRPGEFQSENVILPVKCFSREAEAVKDLRKGDALSVGAHVYGSEFQTADGAVKHGVQLIVDAVFTAARSPAGGELNLQPSR